MIPTMPTKSPIQAVASGRGFKLTRPGARYVIDPSGEEHVGQWVPNDEPVPVGSADVFPKHEARALLPFLRARGTAGRKGAEPTTPDGKLIARACKRLGLTVAALGAAVGVHESTLSRARSGELLPEQRDAINALLSNSVRSIK